MVNLIKDMGKDMDKIKAMDKIKGMGKDMDRIKVMDKDIIKKIKFNKIFIKVNN